MTNVTTKDRCTTPSQAVQYRCLSRPKYTVAVHACFASRHGTLNVTKVVIYHHRRNIARLFTWPVPQKDHLLDVAVNVA